MLAWGLACMVQKVISRVTVITNPRAGSAERTEGGRKISDLFAKHAVESTVVYAGDRDVIASQARLAVAARAQAVVAAGGDGTLSAVASALDGTDVPMGILPTGTLNHFARDLGIPADL